MTNFIESLILALLALKANLMRSILTTLGIIVGVTSVIAVISIMEGFTNKLTQDFKNMGSDVIIIRPYATFKQQMRGEQGKLTLQDLEAIERVVENAEVIIPQYFLGGVSIEYEGNVARLQQFYGTTSAYSDMNSHYPEEGRFIIPSDDKYRRKIVVLGAEARDELGLPDDYIGKYVQIFNQWYKVVGSMEERGSILGMSRDNDAYVPFSTLGALLQNTTFQSLSISVKVKNTNDVTAVTEQLAALLKKRHKIGPDDTNDFKIQSADKIKEQQEDTLSNFTMIVSAVVGISLLVGGIGIMNIMLVSVTERTKEIGICKALGAMRSDILVQFLAEAVILCLLGGMIGIALGYGLGLLAGAMMGGAAVIVPLWAIGLSLGFSSVIGIVFGIIPAAKAANLDPIQALHYE
jgi:putative ABC transport system permease protein